MVQYSLLTAIAALVALLSVLGAPFALRRCPPGHCVRCGYGPNAPGRLCAECGGLCAGERGRWILNWSIGIASCASLLVAGALLWARSTPWVKLLPGWTVAELAATDPSGEGVPAEIAGEAFSRMQEKSFTIDDQERLAERWLVQAAIEERVLERRTSWPAGMPYRASFSSIRGLHVDGPIDLIVRSCDGAELSRHRIESNINPAMAPKPPPRGRIPHS
jgi:hypothetical protein